MAVYGQPSMLAKQVETILNYSQAVRDELTVIIVDDCGDPPASVGPLVDHCKDVQLYRITEDKPWNQPGARNLGMHHARGWCVMLDPDMVIQPQMIARFMKAAGKYPRGHVTKFALKHHSNGSIDMTSPNTYLIHAADFHLCGGYDEDFAGNKGWSDVQLLSTLKAFFKVFPRPDLWVDFYSIREIDDAQVMTIDRSVKVNKAKHLLKNGRAKAAGGWARWTRKEKGPNLRFPWTRLI